MDSDGDSDTGGPGEDTLDIDPDGWQGRGGRARRGKTPFSLFINSPDGHSYSVPVTEGMLVSELRALVEERTPPLQTPWRLTSASRLLDDNQTLEFYRLGHGNTITVSGQIRGGGGPNSSKGGCWAHAQWQDDTEHQRQWTDPAGART